MLLYPYKWYVRDTNKSSKPGNTRKCEIMSKEVKNQETEQDLRAEIIRLLGLIEDSKKLELIYQITIRLL